MRERVGKKGRANESESGVRNWLVGLGPKG